MRFGEEQIVYCLERKTVKNINLRVRRDGVVAVSAGAWVPAERIDAFVVSKGERILAALRHFEEVASLAPKPNHYDDGETFYLLGQALRLQVTRAAQEGVEADGALLRLSVRNEADEAGKRRLLEHYFDRACWTVFNEVMEEALPAILCLRCTNALPARSQDEIALGFLHGGGGDYHAQQASALRAARMHCLCGYA